MTTDLYYLALTAILTASLWIPYVVAQVTTNGLLSAQNYKDPTPRPLPPWGRRADRTYMNAVETFAPFAAVVLIAHMTGEANAMTAFWAAWFFWFHVAHAVSYLAGVPYIRTVVFTAAYVGVMGIAWEVIV